MLCSVNLDHTIVHNTDTPVLFIKFVFINFKRIYYRSGCCGDSVVKSKEVNKGIMLT